MIFRSLTSKAVGTSREVVHVTAHAYPIVTLRTLFAALKARGPAREVVRAARAAAPVAVPELKLVGLSRCAVLVRFTFETGLSSCKVVSLEFRYVDMVIGIPAYDCSRLS